MFKYFISWLILLCSSSFFLIKGIGKGDRVMDIFGVLLIIFLILLHVVYQGRGIIKANFRNHILILILASFGSALMAYMFHGQDYSLTLFQQRSIYFYLFYFLLHYLLPEPIKLERLIIQFGLVYCLVFLLQTVAYPTLITESHVFRDRGTIRIFLPGENVMILGYLIAFDRIFEKFDWLYFSHLMLSVIVVLLLGTRVMLLALVILSFVNILINKRVQNKFAVFFLFIGVAFISYLVMKDTISAEIAETQKHSSQAQNYIRVKAAEYYLTDFQKGIGSIVLGNGSPNDKSSYGAMVKNVNNRSGFYLSDIGILGIYVKYGILFTVVCFIIMFQGLFGKLHRDLHYIKYFMAYLLINMVVSTLPFETSYGIVEICMILYIIDCYKDTSKQSLLLQENNNGFNAEMNEELETA